MLGSAFLIPPLSRLQPPLMPGCDSLEDWHVIEHRSTTLHSNMPVNGSSPAITLTGTLSQLRDFRIEVTTGGLRGTAIVKYSVDGGANYTTDVLTAATIPLGSTGVTANLASGTYAFGDTYRSTYQFWAGRAPNNHRLSNSSSTGAPKVSQTGGNNGRSCFEFAFSSADNFICPNAGLGETDAIATTMAGGSDASLTVFCVFKALGAVSTVEALWGFFNSSTLVDICAMRTGPSNGWNLVKRDSASAAVSQSAGTKDNNWHVGEAIFDGSGTPSATLLIDGSVILNAVGMNVGSLTVDVFQIGHYAAGVDADLLFAEVVMYRGVLGAYERGVQRARLKREHGIA